MKPTEWPISKPWPLSIINEGSLKFSFLFTFPVI